MSRISSKCSHFYWFFSNFAFHFASFILKFKTIIPLSLIYILKGVAYREELEKTVAFFLEPLKNVSQNLYEIMKKKTYLQVFFPLFSLHSLFFLILYPSIPLVSVLSYLWYLSCIHFISPKLLVLCCQFFCLPQLSFEVIVDNKSVNLNYIFW